MKEGKVLAVCLSPTFQNTLVFDDFKEDEVNRAVSDLHIDASGKGINVIRILNQLGRRAECLVQLGGPRIQEYQDIGRKEGLEISAVLCDAITRTCTTVINRRLSTSTELVENAHEVSQKTDKDVKDRFLSLLPGCKALVISGTKAPGFSADIYPWMVKKAKENGLIAVIDVKKQELINCLEHHPDIIKPNLSEFVETFFDDVRITENEDSESLKPRVMEKAKELYMDYGVKTILSRGRFDTWAFDGKEFITVPSINVPVVNTIGCGDSMTAGLVDALLDGRPFAESIRFGMQCAVQRASHLYHGL